MKRIDKIWAYVAEDKEEDIEGVIGMHTGLGWMPLVGADEARIKSLRDTAEQVAKQSGKKVRLVCFETRREVEVIG